jgi:hypothetical protein
MVYVMSAWHCTRRLKEILEYQLAEAAEVYVYRYNIIGIYMYILSEYMHVYY